MTNIIQLILLTSVSTLTICLARYFLYCRTKTIVELQNSVFWREQLKEEMKENAKHFEEVISRARNDEGLEVRAQHLLSGIDQSTKNGNFEDLVDYKQLLMRYYIQKEDKNLPLT